MDSFIDFLIDNIVLPGINDKGGSTNVKAINDSGDDETLPVPQELV